MLDLIRTTMSKQNTSQTVIRLSLIILATLVLFALVTYYNRVRQSNELFTTPLSPSPSPSPSSITNDTYAYSGTAQASPAQAYSAAAYVPGGVEPSSTDALRPISMPDGGSLSIPSHMYPKDTISPSDLLPKDAVNSKWSKANPAGTGDISGQNFLTAGYHIGVDTIGQSLKNANYDLRSIPPNPQHKVSIWQQSSYEPDLSRRPLE